MTDDQSFPQYNPPPSSSGSKTLMWVLLIGGLSLLLCCGGLGIVVWRFGSMAQDFVANMATNDPEEIRRQTAEMVDIDIPNRFQPMQGMNMVAVKMVMYQATSNAAAPQAEQPDPAEAVEQGGAADSAAPSAAGLQTGGGMLMLMQMATDQFGVDAEEQERQLRDSMKQQSNHDFESSDSETRTIEIRGQIVPFEFVTGKTTANGQEQTTHIISGVFRGKEDRPVMLQLTLPEEAYDEAEVTGMLESIR